MHLRVGSKKGFHLLRFLLPQNGSSGGKSLWLDWTFLNFAFYIVWYVFDAIAASRPSRWYWIMITLLLRLTVVAELLRKIKKRLVLLSCYLMCYIFLRLLMYFFSTPSGSFVWRWTGCQWSVTSDCESGKENTNIFFPFTFFHKVLYLIHLFDHRGEIDHRAQG